jgi:hypothetical protein
MIRRRPREPRAAAAGRRAIWVTVVACLMLVSGCGDSGSDRHPSLGAARFRALTAQLAGVGPQGQVSAAQSAATAKRQSAIAARYAAGVGAGGCHTGLQRLSSVYAAFARAAAGSAAGTVSDRAYGVAAGAVSAALGTAEKACG